MIPGETKLRDFAVVVIVMAAAACTGSPGTAAPSALSSPAAGASAVAPATPAAASTSSAGNGSNDWGWKIEPLSAEAGFVTVTNYDPPIPDGFRRISLAFMATNTSSRLLDVGSNTVQGLHAAQYPAYLNSSILAFVTTDGGYTYGSNGADTPTRSNPYGPDYVLAPPGASLPMHAEFDVPTGANVTSVTLMRQWDDSDQPCTDPGACGSTIPFSSFPSAPPHLSANFAGADVLTLGTPVAQGPVTVALTRLTIMKPCEADVSATARNTGGYTVTISPLWFTEVFDGAGTVWVMSDVVDSAGRFINNGLAVPPGASVSFSWRGALTNGCTPTPTPMPGHMWALVWLAPLADPNTAAQLSGSVWGTYDLGMATWP